LGKREHRGGQKNKRAAKGTITSDGRFQRKNTKTQFPESGDYIRKVRGRRREEELNGVDPGEGNPLKR